MYFCLCALLGFTAQCASGSNRSLRWVFALLPGQLPVPPAASPNLAALPLPSPFLLSFPFPLLSPALPRFSMLLSFSSALLPPFPEVPLSSFSPLEKQLSAPNCKPEGGLLLQVLSPCSILVRPHHSPSLALFLLVSRDPETWLVPCIWSK